MLALTSSCMSRIVRHRYITLYYLHCFLFYFAFVAKPLCLNISSTKVFIPVSMFAAITIPMQPSLHSSFLGIITDVNLYVFMLSWGKDYISALAPDVVTGSPRTVVHLQHFSNLLWALKTWHDNKEIHHNKTNDCFQKSTACHSNAALKLECLNLLIANPATTVSHKGLCVSAQYDRL